MKKNHASNILGLFLLFCISSCNSYDSQNDTNGNPNPAPKLITYYIVKSYPHDTASFTQGLEMYNSNVYESTGNPDNVPNNGAWIGKVNLSTGQAEKYAFLPKDFFGEGITILNQKIYRLTWQNQKAFMYNVVDFKQEKEFIYQGEGWGLCNDGNQLIMSNGSNIITYRDPQTFKETRQISVHDNTGMKNNLNELEFINGYIFANVWQTHQILKIDTSSGAVKGILDLYDLIKQDAQLTAPPADVLNGIAWDSSKKTLFITGKNGQSYLS